MSAVSKKITPPSAAARTSGSASFSSSTHCLLLLSPKLIMPRQMRDTRRPVEPRLTYSMNTPLEAIQCQMLPTHADGMPLRGQRHLEHVCHSCGNGDILVSPLLQRRHTVPRNEEVAWDDSRWPGGAGARGPGSGRRLPA